MKSIIFILPLFMWFQTNAQSIITDRPDQTESSSTVHRSSLQIESGVLIGFTELDGNEKMEFLAPSTLFRYGLTDKIEIRVLSQLESSKYLSDDLISIGISDIEIGTKIQLVQGTELNTEMAFLTHVVVPSGSNTLSNRKIGSINKMSISHELSEKASLGYNVGYNFFTSTNKHYTYSIALGISITSKLGIYIEPYGEWIDTKNHLHNIDSGFTYLIRDNLQFDFSFGTGLNHKMNYISSGVSWNIKD